MIRFICIAVFLILYLILSIPVFLVEWIIGKFNRRAKDISSLRIVQWGFKVILKMTGVTTTVIGEENVPDQLLGNLTVDLGAGFEVFLQPLLPGEDDQRAHLFPPHGLAGTHGLGDDRVHLLLRKRLLRRILDDKFMVRIGL